MYPSNFGIQDYVDASERQDRYRQQRRAHHPSVEPSRGQAYNSTWRETSGQAQHNHPHLPSHPSFSVVPQGTPNAAYPSSQTLGSTYTAPSNSMSRPYTLPDQSQPWAGFPPQYPEYPANSTTNANDYYSSGPSYTHSMPPELYYSQEIHRNGWTNGSQEPVARSQIATEAVLDASERRRTHPHKYWCQYCRTGFTAKHNLDRHESAHNNEKKFTCELCPSSFTTKADLKRHMEKSKKHSQLPSHVY